jgi:competence protein ComK
MNCLDNGSSFEGRVSGSRHLLSSYQKVPIMICSENQIYFFPTTSPEHADCIWINPLHIKHYKKFDKKVTLVIFNNNQSMKIPVSLYTFHNQHSKTLSLMNLKNQKKRENNGNMSYFNQNNAGMAEYVSDQGIFLNYENFS